MKQLIGLTLAALSFAFNLGCERNASNKSRITLALPSELQERIEKSQVSSFTALRLQHVALQITAPDITSPIRVILDSGDDNTSLPATIEVEIPPGDNRLVQLIAAYAADGGDSPSIYYGDVTQSLRRSTENIALPVYKLGGTGVSTMARISGRFLTAPNSGPTGVIDMVYRPNGKPAMPVDKKPILAGWFETSTFEDVPMDYLITAHNGSTYALGTQWMSSSIATSERVVRFSTPDAFETIWNNMGSTQEFRSREREDLIVGFFANDPALIAAKSICVTSQTDLGGGSVHAERALNTASAFSARPFKHFFSGGPAPTYSATEVTIVGGKRIVSCGALNYAQEFIDYLWFLPNLSMGQATNEDFLQSMGSKEGFVHAVFMEPHNGTLARSYSRDLFLNGEMNRTFKVLPGLENVVDKINIYQAPAGNYGGGDDRCDRINPSSWVLQGTYPADFSGSELLVKASLMPNPYGSYAVCLSAAGKPVGRLAPVYNASSSWAPPQQVNLANPSAVKPQPGQCIRMVANLVETSGSATMYPATSAINVTVNSAISGTPTAVIYPDATCIGTPQSTQSITIAPGDINAAFFFKVSTEETLTFSIASNSASLTHGSDVDVIVSNPWGSLDRFAIEPYFNDRSPLSVLHVYEHGCFPLRVRALNASNGPTSVTGTVPLSLQDLVGNAASLPAGFNFYETCAASTPLTNLNFTSESAKTFVIKTQGNVPLNKSLKMVLGAAINTLSINPASLAHTLAFEYAGSPANLNLVTYQCTPVYVKLKDSNGAYKIASEDIPVNLNNYDNDNLRFFSSASCTTAITSTIIPSGSTGALTYIRALSTSISQSPMASSPGVNNSANLNMNITPSSLVATPAIGSTAPSTTLSVSITGGNAPYTTSPLSNVTSATIPSQTGNEYQFNMTVGGTAGPATVTLVDNSGQTLIVTVTVTP